MESQGAFNSYRSFQTRVHKALWDFEKRTTLRTRTHTWGETEHVRIWAKPVLRNQLISLPQRHCEGMQIYSRSTVSTVISTGGLLYERYSPFAFFAKALLPFRRVKWELKADIPSVRSAGKRTELRSGLSLFRWTRVWWRGCRRWLHWIQVFTVDLCPSIMHRLELCTGNPLIY